MHSSQHLKRWMRLTLFQVLILAEYHWSHCMVYTVVYVACIASSEGIPQLEPEFLEKSKQQLGHIYSAYSITGKSHICAQV